MRGRKVKSSKKLVIIIATALILIIGGGTVYATNTPTARAERQLNLGNKYLQEGKYQEAILAFEKVIQIDPKNILARLRLGNVYIATNELSKAEDVLKEVINIEKSNIPAREELIKVYAKEGNLDAVDGVLKDITDIDPKINISKYNNDLESAKAISISKASYNIGVKQMNDKQYLDAMNSFQKVIKEDTARYSDAQVKSVDCKKAFVDSALKKVKDFASNKDYKAALDYLEQIIKIDPNNPDALKLKKDYLKVYNIYPIKTNEEKKELISYMTNFSQGFDNFDANKASDEELLYFAIFNMNAYLGPSYSKVDGVPAKQKDGMPFTPVLAKEVDQYIKDMFGVIPNKKPEYTHLFNGGTTDTVGFYENGYYFLEAGGRGAYLSSMQFDRMNDLGDGVMYVKFTIYDFIDGKIDDFSWDSVERLDPIEKWSNQTKRYSEKGASGYAIIRQVIVDGKTTRSLLRFKTGAKLSEQELMNYK